MHILSQGMSRGGVSKMDGKVYVQTKLKKNKKKISLSNLHSKQM